MTNYNYPGKFKDQLIYKNKIRERDGYICQLCGADGNQIDHIIPFAISHDNTEGNLRVLCKPCNLRIRRERKDAALPIDQWEQAIRNELGMVRYAS
jgi:hypothetical protein